MDGDIRKDYIIRSAANYFGIDMSMEMVKSHYGSQDLNKFLDLSNIMSLSALNENDGLKFSEKYVLPEKTDHDYVLVFFKIYPEAIDGINYHSNISMATMMSKPMKSLYYTLQRIYAPLIIDNVKINVDAKILSQVKELEISLHKSFFKDELTPEIENEILTMEDEINFWKNANTVENKQVKQTVKVAILDLLNQIDISLKSFKYSVINEAEESIDNIFNTMDDLWKFDSYQYPESRMKVVINIIGNYLVTTIQEQIGDHDFTHTQSKNEEENLKNHIIICDKFLAVCEKFTSFYWPHLTEHTWKSGLHLPLYLKGFYMRLIELQRVIQTYKQLSSLFTSKESAEFAIETFFEPFKGIKPYYYNQFTEPIWKAAIEGFSLKLAPAEEKIVSRLQHRFQEIGANVPKLFQELKHYCCLIERESIKKKLTPERREIFKHILSFFINLKPKPLENPLEVVETPELVKNIFYTRQTLAKIVDISQLITVLFDDVNGYDEFLASEKDIHSSMKAYEELLFEEWKNKTLKKNLSINTEDSVVQFEQGKLMQVTFSPLLLPLIKETRQLYTLGLPVSNSLMEAAAKASRFIDEAKALNQIATFHNTIGDRMVNSQRAMMLSSAREFSRLVQAQHKVTWESGKMLTDYIKKLQIVADKLSMENSKLVQYHRYIIEKVEILMDTDLLKQLDYWKTAMKDIRKSVHEVEEEFTTAKHWCNHIDYQIYKSLEYQYKLTLVKLNETIPEFHLELVYRNHKIEYRPDLYQIKRDYYKKVRSVMQIPIQMQGVGGVDIYPSVIYHSINKLRRVYAEAEDMFIKLENFTLVWYKWLALGTENIDSYIEKCIIKPDDFLHNFRASKYFSQQIATLPSTKKIGPFLVSLDGLRNTIESQNRRYWASVTLSLRSSILNDVSTIQSFHARAEQLIQHQPQKVEEITEAHYNYNKMFLESEEISLLLEDLDVKNKLLLSWIKETIPVVEDIKKSWNNFKIIIANYNLIISSKAETLKLTLGSEKEILIEDIERFILHWQEFKPNENTLLNPTPQYFEDSLAMIRQRKDQWIQLMEKNKKMAEDYEKLGMEVTLTTDYSEIENDIFECEKTWSLMEEFNKGLQQLTDEEWIVMRSKAYAKTDVFLEEWVEKLKTIPKSPVTLRIQQDIDQYKEVLPMLQYVRGDTFTEQHWSEVFIVLEAPPKPLEAIKFGDFLYKGQALVSNIQTIQNINIRAANEVVIRQGLSELDVWEAEAKFNTYDHIDSKGKKLKIIKDFKNIMDKVGDNQCLLQSIKGSTNMSQFADRVTLWEDRLTNLDMYLHDLNQVQRKWAYLEPIFGSGALEEKRFDRIDKEWRYIMQQLSTSHFKVVYLTRINNISHTLQQLLQNLLQCQKTLQNYLEDKRLKFPRFYFINDDDLLEILGQASKHNIIQTHLKKIFAGIHSVDIKNDKITTIFSVQSEAVLLHSPVLISPNIEEWLENLSLEVQATLKLLLIDCLKKPDPLKFPYQVLCLAERITFTRNCEKAINNNALISFEASMKEQRNEYVKDLLEWSGGILTTPDDGHVLQLKLKALLLDTIYYLNVIQDLIASNVSSLDDWHWKKVLRFYCEDNNDVVVRMVDAEFKYTYEYQGAYTKLVHTDLTDKCYLTLTQAVNMGFGGNPYGPAGTGKTESVKALGALLGRQVLVFNCDEGLDVKSLTRIMVGLVKCGAWGCFDEFNRLDQTTLSLISSQINIIQEALRNRSSEIVLLEKTIEVNHNSGIFITLNPVGKGYGGRQKLPENLKQLFRPVLMSKPDDVDIAKVILLCEGYQSADEIGVKLVTLFNLAKKLLSYQQHYDWGLRAMKTVVGSCGTALRNFLSLNQVADSNETFEGHSSNKLSKRVEMITIRFRKEIENELTVQAVRLNTLCKLTFTDSARFEQLVKDVFPAVGLTRTGYNDIINAIAEAYVDLKLKYNERQAAKCIELFEQLKQRMGVVVVGPSGSGKSSIISIIKTALSKLGSVIRHDIISPKSMNRHDLLGQIDPDTRQWSDGVLTSVAQQIYNEPQSVQCWVHCDGDVDPEWIESLNSVLDDNHLLTLPSGSRIQFGDNVHFIFETHDLSYASPATISRMGIILLSRKDLTIESLIDAWNDNLDDQDGVIKNFVEEYFYKVVKWLSENGEFIVDVSLNFAMLNCLKTMKEVRSKTQFCSHLLNEFGGNMTQESKEKFSKMLMDLTNEFIFDTNPGLFLYYEENSDTLKDYRNYVEFTRKPLNIVFTPMMQYARDVVMSWLNRNQSFIILGPAGSGKSTLLEYCFTELHNTEIIDIDCSAYISPQHILQKLNQTTMMVSNSSRRILRPKNADQIIVHFSDINVVQSDKYGTKMLTEFLTQIYDHGGFYDSSNEWIGMEHVIFVYSVTSVGDLSKRFLSKNQIFNLRHPSNNELQEIYTTLMKRVLSAMNNTVISAIINVYETVCKELNHSQHGYNFCQRDVARWCTNFLRYDLSDNKSICEAFVHEGNRLFRDKLFEEDRVRFDGILKNEINSKFDVNLSDLEDIYFTSYKKISHWSENNSLLRIESKDYSHLVRQASLQLGGDNFTTLLTPDLLKLTEKIECALTENNGNILLAAKSGAGRKTALNIVSQRQNCVVYFLKLGDNYSVFNFQSDMKAVLQMGGINDEQVFLLIEDYQILREEFLNMLSSLVSSGEILGLYQPEEIDNVTAPLKPIMMEENYEFSVSHFFRERVSRNVHVILSFDYDDVAFIERLKNNPALLKNCYQVRIEHFSNETMYAIPHELLNANGDQKVYNNREEEQELIEGIINLHNSARNVARAPPLSYFNLIKLFMAIKIEKKTMFLERQNRLKAGISKITEAQNIVEKLKTDASEQKILLDEKQAKGKQVLDQISETMANASLQRTDIEQLRSKTEEENKNLQIRKVEIDKELAGIEPLIKEAQAAVGNIKTEALSEIRSLRAPPLIIRDILVGVLRLMGIQDTSWNSMKTFLAKRGVKEEIRFFDASQITIENRNAVEELLKNDGASFDSKNAKRASVAAAPLAAWVKANVEYSKVLEKIRPLETEQAKLQKNLEAAEMQIEELGTGLTSVDQVVSKLKDQLSSSTKEAAEIEVHLKNAHSTILAAEGLVTKLDEEFKIWVKQLSEISSTLETLSFNSLLAAAFITYLSDLPKQQRWQVLNRWKEILKTDAAFDVTEFLSTEREMLQWSAEGLPEDEYSRQNAIIILNAMLPPFLLDPASIATMFLKQHFSKEQIDIVAQQSPMFITKVELAVRFGKVLIVEDIEYIHPVLEPILRNNFVQQGTRKMVYIGQKLVDCHSSFKLFLTSRSIGLEASKKLKASFPILNFGATTEGLTQQLLGCALKVEKPTLEKRRVELLHEEEQFKSRLYFLQEKVLQELASSHGDILQNQELLTSLKNSKESSAAIKNSLEESMAIKKDMMKEYEVYMPLSEYGTKLFFACSALSKINNMYYISVATFLKLYENSILTSVDLEINSKYQHLLVTVYKYIARSLFKADRLAFALHLVHETLPELFGPNEWELFTDQNVSDASLETQVEKNDLPKWIKNDRVQQILKLQAMLPDLYAKLKLQTETYWLDFMINPMPKLPNHCDLTKFQLILVIQALRPDTLHSSLNYFAVSSLGLSSLSPTTLQLHDLLGESTPSEPILIISSPGNDPSKEITALAFNKSISIQEIAVGPGQEKEIQNGLNEAAKNGKWIILKNLHLLISWLPSLKKVIQELKPVPEFKLWLVTEAHLNFSPTLLSSSLKITYEAPPGVKRNIERTYNEWNSNKLMESTLQGAQSMFVLAWFHAIIQERRTYIPQGWTSFYEFNDNDLSVATTVIKKRLKEKDIKKQWEYIHGLFELTIYGGRVNNIYDLRVISAYLSTLFNSNMLQGNGEPLAPGVELPSTADINEHLSLIRKLPEGDKPEYFGLPKNVARIWQRVTSSKTVASLKDLEKNVVSGDAVGMSKLSAILSPLVKLWKQMNQRLGLIYGKKPDVNTNDEPIVAFFSLELAFAIDLISQIHSGLVELMKIVKIGIFPSKASKDMASSILIDEVPDEWDKTWSGPSNPKDYLRSAVRRALKVQKMQEDVSSISEAPVDLNDLFNVESFIMAIRQQAARKSQISIEKMELFTSWTRVKGDLLSGHASVTGVLLEGALMKDSYLVECTEESPSVVQAPPFVISWQVEPYLPDDFSRITVPLYSSENRETLVAELTIPCIERDKNKWIKSGIAFYIFS